MNTNKSIAVYADRNRVLHVVKSVVSYSRGEDDGLVTVTQRPMGVITEPIVTTVLAEDIFTLGVELKNTSRGLVAAAHAAIAWQSRKA